MIYRYLTCSILFLCLGCQPSDDKVINIGTDVWPGYEPLYIAREKGFYNPAHFRLIELSSASQTIEAYKNNQIDIAAVTLDEAIRLQSIGEEIVVIAVLDISLGGDGIVAQTAISQMNQLIGKRIGVESSALGSLVLSRAFEIHSLEQHQVDLVYLPIEQHEQAFKSKAVDAVITFEPVLSALKGNVIFNSSEMPNEIIDVLIIRKSVLQKYQHKVAALLAAWSKGVDFIHNQELEALNIMAKRLNTEPAFVKIMLNKMKLLSLVESERMLDINSAESIVKNSLNLADIMIQNNIITHKPDVRELFDRD